ncbi:MAG: protein phosphatase 2C domain-containing protein [Actinomycetaceae bacterium]|nr:protein phosphatase 2C domain-containing protein [Arcanobacterium sp.]MDD7505112.1 protein phosphatase 2C domain-containing protein [Actinomycetaceae bacterium]MDY6142629.1 protein phosphatase 2C domain-containing protein [Arcanobacterium sp.]
MTIGFSYTAFSDIGLIRKTNQDGGYASPNMLVLADGMGGAAAGDIASSVAIAHLAQVDDVHPADELLPQLRAALHGAHRELYERSEENPDLTGMGTTCIAVLRANNKLAMVHIGDSRAYLLRKGKLIQVTHDHTLVQYLVDQGKITPEEAEVHPKRNVIMRALSDTPEPIELDESVREAVPGDRWLLCSDGLFGVVSKETIEQTLSNIEDLDACGEQLIDYALAGGAPDNVTVVLADVVDFATHPQVHERGPIVVGSAAVDHARPSRQGASAAGQAAGLVHGEARSGATPYQDAASSQSAASSHISMADGDSTGSDARSASRSPGVTLPNDRADARRRNARKRRLLPKILITLGIIAVFVGGAWGGYTWSQTRYYVGDDNGTVTIFRGIPQEIGPLKLYSPYEASDIETKDLTVLDRLNVKKNILTHDLDSARDIVNGLAQRARADAPAKDTDSDVREVRVV